MSPNFASNNKKTYPNQWTFIFPEVIKKHRFSDDIKENKSSLIHLNLFNIRR